VRWTRLFVAFVFLGLSAACALWGASTTTRSPDPTALRWLEQLTRTANTELRAQIQKRLSDQASTEQEIITRWKKKDLTYQALLNTAFAPRMIWMDEKRIRSSSFRYVDEMPAILADFANQRPDSTDVQVIGEKYFLLNAARFRGTSFVAAYDLAELFNGLNISPTLQSWIATTDGKILYHPSQRFLNESVENLRPIASVNTSLQSGQLIEPFEKFLTPDSQEAYGTWSILADLKLVVTTEWRGDLPIVTTNNYFWTLMCGVLLALSVVSFLWSFASASPTGISTHQDNPSLFLTQQIELLRSERDQLGQQLNKTQFQTKINLFWDELLNADTGNQVWQLQLDFLAQQQELIQSLVSYRFSHTSCSLVPESDRGLAKYDQVAQRFLRDSRIFLGSSKHLVAVEQTEAFKNWLTKRQKYLPMDQEKLFFLPFNGGTTFRGAVLLSLQPQISEQDHALLILKSLVNRTACLYEQKVRLLELTNAKQKRRTPKEGAPNHI
jgi:hypothetical protein